MEKYEEYVPVNIKETIARTYIENPDEAMSAKLSLTLDCKNENGKMVVYVKDVKEPVWVIKKEWPKAESISERYTKKGYEAVINHEKRREKVYKNAHDVYIDIVLGNIKKLNYILKDGISIEEGNKKMNEYITKYYTAALDDAIIYIKKNQKEITKECKDANLIKSKNKINGIRNAYKIPNARPTATPKREDGMFFKD